MDVPPHSSSSHSSLGTFRPQEPSQVKPHYRLDKFKMKRLSVLSVSLLFLGSLLLPLLLQVNDAVVVTAKELEPKADEWTVIGENDTIPPGMHVRIDMTTGEKWVKQITDDDGDDRFADDGGNAGAAVAVQVSGDLDPSDVSSSDNNEPYYDYDRMFETLAQLPPEEFERVGGLPEPVPKKATTAAQRQYFEARMKEIWELRQEELRQIQREQMVDFPEVLKTQIGYLRDYYNGQGERDTAQIKEDLQELEFLLTDVDMARDFYTLQGWPWLLALLMEDQNNETATTEVQGLQAAAAWVVGTAVQNTGEFGPWVVEPILLPNGAIISALDALVHVWNDRVMDEDAEVMTNALPQKVLYALSACLRGNPLAQHVFHHKGQPARLRQDLRDTSADTAHGRKQILRILQLGSDLIMEWNHALKDAAVGFDDSIAAAIDGFRQMWVTPDWCDVVLDKVHIVSQADKRLPVVNAWYPHCQSTWDSSRVHDLLAIEIDDEDKDTKALREKMTRELTDTTRSR